MMALPFGDRFWVILSKAKDFGLEAFDTHSAACSFTRCEVPHFVRDDKARNRVVFS
jgi:hypothetical protein